MGSIPIGAVLPMHVIKNIYPGNSATACKIYDKLECVDCGHPMCSKSTLDTFYVGEHNTPLIYKQLWCHWCGDKTVLILDDNLEYLILSAAVESNHCTEEK